MAARRALLLAVLAAAACRTAVASPTSGRGGLVCRVNAAVSRPSTTRRHAARNASMWDRSCSDSSGMVWRAERAVRVGEYLRTRVAGLAGRFPVISAVRGYGLIAGIDLRAEGGRGGREFTASVVEWLLRRRVLVGSTGRRGDVLKVRPPLIWREEHADHFAAALAAVLAGLTG